MTSISLSLTDFWIPLLQIIGVNIVLSGDNAVVIAMAARSLAPDQQKKAIFWGSGAAIVMRILLTIFAVKLLVLPYLKLVGAALLLWIGHSLLAGGDDEEIDSSDHLLTAIKTILLADLVMSLDNVIGVAAAAKGSTFLLVAGLAISIPLVIFGASMLLKVMERFPLIITVGGGLLGWIAGDMAVNDPAIKDWVDTTVPHLHEAAPVLGVLIVLVTGKFLSKSSPAE